MLRKVTSTSAVVSGKAVRQFIWEAIRIMRESFSVHDIVRRSGQMPSDIKAYLKALTLASVVEVIEADGRKCMVYRLVRDEGVDHPRLNAKGERTTEHLAIENVWRTLRIMGGEMTVADVMAAANVGKVSISKTKAAAYLKALTEAGYLVRIKGATSRKPDTYQLKPSRYTGPCPPVVNEMESLQVFDPNLGRVVYAKAANRLSEPFEDVWAKAENQRLRNLLAEWLRIDDWRDDAIAPRDLIERTQLELAPATSGALQ